MSLAPIDWLTLFPARDFRHPMATRRGDLAAYFAPHEEDAGILRQRIHWLSKSPEQFAIGNDNDRPIFEEALATLNAQCAPHNSAGRNLLEQIIDCGKRCEADWVVLHPNDRIEYVLRGGVVCFPSGWALREKIGLSLAQIHAIVPGLNEALQGRIDSFLSALKPGETFERSNWGLAADAELNHHPSRQLPRLSENAPLSETWIRLEHQLLYRLPKTQALLFAIRVSLHSLDDVSRFPGAAARIAHALRTMPEAVAAYKGIAPARAQLIRQLEDRSA